MELLGIDVGGSGIKGAPVDVEKGVLTAERLRVLTPNPSTPQAVGKAVVEIVKHFNWNHAVGCTFPAVVKNGITYSAANVDQGWLKFEAEKFLQEQTGCPLALVNDADAAGLAEARFGAGKGVPGVVIVLTFGTGIGSALLLDGQLVPNTEFGHLEIRGKDAETRASDAARAQKDLSWKKWAARVNEYLARLEMYFSPDLFVIGGGVSKNFAKFGGYLQTERTKIVPAQLLNEAGIVGAALAAKRVVPAARPRKAATPPKKTRR